MTISLDRIGICFGPEAEAAATSHNKSLMLASQRHLIGTQMHKYAENPPASPQYESSCLSDTILSDRQAICCRHLARSSFAFAAVGLSQTEGTCNV